MPPACLGYLSIFDIGILIGTLGGMEIDDILGEDTPNFLGLRGLGSPSCTVVDGDKVGLKGCLVGFHTVHEILGLTAGCVAHQPFVTALVIGEQRPCKDCGIVGVGVTVGIATVVNLRVRVVDTQTARCGGDGVQLGIVGNIVVAVYILDCTLSSCVELGGSFDDFVGVHIQFPFRRLGLIWFPSTLHTYYTTSKACCQVFTKNA